MNIMYSQFLSLEPKGLLVLYTNMPFCHQSDDNRRQTDFSRDFIICASKHEFSITYFTQPLLQTKQHFIFVQDLKKFRKSLAVKHQQQRFLMSLFVAKSVVQVQFYSLVLK